MYDGRTRVLAEGQDTLCRRLGIAQELQGNVLVVLRSLGVVEDGGYLLVVLTPQHELHVVEALLCEHGKGLGGDLKNLVSLELSHGNSLLGEEVILCLIFAHLEHGRILEFCHIA